MNVALMYASQRSVQNGAVVQTMRSILGEGYGCFLLEVVVEAAVEACIVLSLRGCVVRTRETA